MKKLFSRFSSMKGFTMIELLVVIAIIGVLAVAMLSAINPLEQINRGRDTRDRSDAAELLGGLERFYATREAWPVGMEDGTIPADSLVTIVPSAVVQDLLDAEEVKAGFNTRMANATNLNIYYIQADPEDRKIYVCFEPASQQFKDEAVRNCLADTDGNLPSIACLHGPYDAASVYTDELVCIP